MRNDTTRMCDCELGHNGLGMAIRECDCDERKAAMADQPDHNSTTIPRDTDGGLLPRLRVGYCDAGCNPSICMCSLAEEAADEIERLRATLREIRRDIEESADDVVWMRGGIETVCDRITAVLGDNHEQHL